MESEGQRQLVSIIIRTKNEERWIGPCLRAVFSQSYKPLEVIIVDNKSTDKTLAKAEQYPVRVISVSEFRPGDAINQGIYASKGEYIVCLSGHCIPTTEDWLANLLRNLDDQRVAGVYGRQEPLNFSSDFDKRDLVTVFGLDRIVQRKDTFFHNANSAFRRHIWEQFPFDPDVTNIEDRLWARDVLEAGYSIIYEPESSVYHWHGIHQDLDRQRARKIVRILEGLDGLVSSEKFAALEDLNIIAIVPIRGSSLSDGRGNHLLEHTIAAAKCSKYLKRIVVSTDDEGVAKLARQLGAEAPFLRGQRLSEDYIDLSEVLEFSLSKIEETGPVPDLVVLLEETYPFRPGDLIDAMIKKIVDEGLDTVVAAHRERRHLWVHGAEGAREIGEPEVMPRRFRETESYIGLFGLCTVTHPSCIRCCQLAGNNVGLFEVGGPFAAIEITTAEAYASAALMLEDWKLQHGQLQQENKIE